MTQAERDSADIAEFPLNPRHVELPQDSFWLQRDLLWEQHGIPAARRECNMHHDCDAADAKAGHRVEHCHADDCSECFGS